jgi:arsenate reductase
VRTVLFVCVENTFRSVLSEALFNATPPPGWRAESAGVQAATEINPVVPELLREIGIALGAKTPRTVSPDLIARASRVVTFGCLDRCPIGAKEKAEDWPIPGATGKTMDELHAIRDELRQRVADLGTRLAASTVSAKLT